MLNVRYLSRWLALSALLSALPVAAVELMKWERIPLPVPLHVGQERIVFVDKNVRAGFPAALGDRLRIQSTGGALYLLASAPFPATRIQLQDKETGELLLLDISATAVPDTTPVKEPVRLVYSGEVTTTTPATGSTTISVATPASTASPVTQTADKTAPARTPVAVALTRYAAQTLYAPARTVAALPGVRNVTSPLPARITTLLPGAPLTITPLATWQLGDHYVVALKLQNTAARRLTPDPRQLQGRFYSATFQHPWLGGAGTAEDTTTLYLVTRGRPDQAFIPEPVCRQPRKKAPPVCTDATGRPVSSEVLP